MLKFFLAGVMLLPLMAVAPEAEAKKHTKRGRCSGGVCVYKPKRPKKCNLCQPKPPPFYVSPMPITPMPRGGLR